MSDQNTETKEQPSYLELSDDEIMKMGAPVVPEVPKDESKTGEKPVEGEEADDKTQGEAKEPDSKEPDEGVDDEGAGEAETPKSEEADVKETKDKSDDSGGEPDAKDKSKEEKGEKEDSKESTESTIDYKAEYERLTAPFKANGRDIKVDSVDDAIALMQMGANYTKKMAALKPNLKLLKSLENAGLLSDEKIGFLIDLSRKDPGAINKLVKESGIDPMELDAEKATAYKPKTYAVDDKEIELDTVLEELQGSETYTRTLDVVSNKWDAASKRAVADSPQLLKVLNDHMASGIYDRISNEVERDRMLGRLSGLSDIEAYHKVGDAINARGGFADLLKVKQNDSPKPPAVIPAKPKAKVDDKLNEKRRAASSTKPAAPAPKPGADFNPLALSDEEFSKLTLPKFK